MYTKKRLRIAVFIMYLMLKFYFNKFYHKKSLYYYAFGIIIINNLLQL